MFNTTPCSRKSATLFVLLFLATYAGAAAEERAIDFRATTLTGTPFHGSELEGKIVLLNFWAVWCPPCLKAIPTLGKLQRDFEGRGFQVLGVASYSGSPEDVAAFVKEHDVRYSMVVGDDDLVERFGVIGYPTYFLIDAEGHIARKYVGELDNLYDVVAADVHRIAALKER